MPRRCWEEKDGLGLTICAATLLNAVSRLASSAIWVNRLQFLAILSTSRSWPIVGPTDLVKLVNLAGLDAEFGVARGNNIRLDGFWTVTKGWKESARYEEKSEGEARALYEAVSDNPDGVFRWIQSRW
jgi:hypothetical protein